MIWKKVSGKWVFFPSLCWLVFPLLMLFCALLRVVEQSGPRLFGLDNAEVARRRQYVGRMRKEVEVRCYFPFDSLR